MQEEDLQASEIHLGRKNRRVVHFVGELDEFEVGYLPLLDGCGSQRKRCGSRQWAVSWSQLTEADGQPLGKNRESKNIH